MSPLARAAVAAMFVIAAGAGTLYFMSPRNGVGPSPTPTPTPGVASPTPGPTISDAACRLLQSSEVDAISPGYGGLGALAGPGGRGAVTTCVYSSGGGDIQLRLTLTSPGGAVAFAAAKRSAEAGTFTDEIRVTPGLGDDNFFEPVFGTTYLLKGDSLVAIVPLFPGTTTEQQFTQGTEEARIILRRL